MKALSIRLDDNLGKEFDEICRKTGYKKNTLLTRLIATFVRHQKKTGGGQKGKDPFLDVIGLMQMGPFLGTPISDDDVDQVVYDL